MISDIKSNPTVNEADIAVRSLVIPLDGMTLLVPNALVSEVATLGTMETAANAPAWMHGLMEWRGLGVPLISFERIFGMRGGSPVRNSRAIVFNTLNGNRQLPFMAVLSQKIPRLLLVSGRMLKSTTGVPEMQGILSRVELQGENVLIPDIDKMENLLLRHGVKVERMSGSNH